MGPGVYCHELLEGYRVVVAGALKARLIWLGWINGDGVPRVRLKNYPKLPKSSQTKFSWM